MLLDENKIHSGMPVFVKSKGKRGIITSIHRYVIPYGGARAVSDSAVNVMIPKDAVIYENIALSDLSPICDDIFKIGDKVRSLLTCSNGNRGFKGIVTGFEFDTNKVVCLSGHEDYRQGRPKERVRYAYGIDEIATLPGTYTFELNNIYNIGNDTKVRAVESPCEEDGVLLINTKTGKIEHILRGAEVTWKELEDALITSVQKCN